MDHRSACVVGVGEIIWDQLPDGDTIGGAPFNVVSHLARLGYQTGYLSAVGQDHYGDAAITEITARGIATTLVDRVSQAPTGRAVVSLTPEGSPEFEIVRPAAYEHLTASAQDVRWVASQRPRAIVFGTLALLRPAAQTAVRRVIDSSPDAIRLYDVNLRHGWWSASAVTELLGLATVVKFSEGEARELAPLLGVRWQGPAAFARQLAAAAGLRGVAVTSGSAAAYLWLDGSAARRRPPAITSVDAVGAGDAFAAGLLDAIIRGLPTAVALHRATALGSLVASRQGAQPQWTPDELEKLSPSWGAPASTERRAPRR